MPRRQSSFSVLLLISVALQLSACGGGGGSSPTTGTSNITVTCPNGTQQTGANSNDAYKLCTLPKVISTSPTDGDQSVVPSSVASIAIETDSTLDPTTVTSLLLSAGTSNTEGVVTLSTAGKGFSFSPKSALRYGQLYEFSFAKVKDSQGRALDKLTIRFSTAPIKCLSSQRPSTDGQSCMSAPVCEPPNTSVDPWTCLPPPGLVDSGQTQCDSGGGVMAACSAANAGDASALPRQDGRFGRDVSSLIGKLVKIGAGASGFDYSKISNSGQDLGIGIGLPLGTNQNDWACTRDNTTGLTWEVKVNDPAHIRHQGWIYSWYSTDGNTNGGNAGVASRIVLPQYSPWCKVDGRCDTEKYIADVNTAALCGYTDWRMPTGRELLTLVHAGKYKPAIDEDYFPNTSTAHFYQTGTTFLEPQFSMAIDFSDGGSFGGAKDQYGVNVAHVRLVRGKTY